MEPIPTKAEMPPKPKSPEAKPAATPTMEHQKGKPVEKTTEVNARGTLEEIAKGTPVAEATATGVEDAPMPDREQVSKLLEETNALLLELRDMRLLVSAVATQSADTPLGNETRLDALRMIRDMNLEGLPPDQTTAATVLQEKIRGLKLPDAKPENSALVSTITNYNEAHPNAAIPQEVIDQIKSGSRDTASTVAQFMQSNPELAQDVWKQLTNVDGFSGLNPNPTNILQLAGIATTPENLAKANEMFGTIANMTPAQKESIIAQLSPMLMGGALILMFFTQIATGQSEGGEH